MVRVTLKTDEYDAYFQSLDEKSQNKYDYTLQILQTQKVVSEKFVKKIQNSDFYEVRVSVGTNEHRTILIACDHPNFMEATQVVLLNSFLKKSTQQYEKEVEKARKIVKRLEEQQ
ncbi:MAG: type II toxin-antitoxin system RelE/ParE family toxin [Prevotellaceae bacterium]|jgi:phage-related protein|nr:type II toxin-antitoxin system RelE/ParE family toxin [Prevotellaceae bacterium]